MLRVSVLCLGLSTGLLACSSESGKKAPLPNVPAPDENALARRGSPFQLEWAMNPLWEDGQTEVAEYKAEQVVNGESLPLTYVQLTGKREFNQQYNVETRERKRRDIFPVLQIQQLYTVPSVPYPQHLQACLVFRRDQPVQLHKLTASVQEWGGSVFKSLIDDGLQYQQQYNSYQDGEGSGHRTLHRYALLEDALPYTLRTLDFASTTTFDARVYGLQLTNHAAAPTLYQAQVSVTEAAPVDNLQPAWRVRVRLAANRENVYWFAKAYPNVLVRQTTWDGRRLWLQKVVRRPMQAQAALADSAATQTVLDSVR